MFILIPLTIFIFYLPIIINPNLLLSRGNDLEQQFWPVLRLVRENFMKFHQIPLWNNLFFSGTSLISDPQFSPIYPANFLFILLPTNIAFVIFFIAHSFLAAITSYILAKKGLNFSRKSSLFFSLLYMTTPKLAGYIDAGHYGLFAAHAWVPLAIYAIFKLSKKAVKKDVVLLAISFSGLYFTHTVIFLITVSSSLILFLFLILLNKKREFIKKIFFFAVAIIIGFGLCAATLLPQTNWIPYSTRSLLTVHPDVYPKWNSIKEFFNNFVFLNHTNIGTIDEEKWITIGIIPLFFSLFGFYYLKRKFKFTVTIVLFVFYLLLINNLSPLYSTLLFENWYRLMRVTTRFWFIPATILLILAAFGLEKITQKFRKPYKILVFGVAVLAILENLYISELRVVKKPFLRDILIQNDLLDYFKTDNSQFRIFCTTRCVSQKQASQNNLELVEGYNTLQQMDYYLFTQSMFGGSWDYYTLPIPPSGIGKLSPNPELLGDYNVKYIISPYKLENNNFIIQNKYSNNFYLYKNNLFKPRSNQEIIYYSPDTIKINIIDKNSPLLLRDIYSDGWHAYLDGKDEVQIKETKNYQREVNIQNNTKFVEFNYFPKSFKIGLIISLITLVIIFLILK